MFVYMWNSGPDLGSSLTQKRRSVCFNGQKIFRGLVSVGCTVRPLWYYIPAFNEKSVQVCAHFYSHSLSNCCLFLNVTIFNSSQTLWFSWELVFLRTEFIFFKLGQSLAKTIVNNNNCAKKSSSYHTNHTDPVS